MLEIRLPSFSLCAIRHFDACLFADELVVGALVDILKSSPPADVADKDMVEISSTGTDILN
jgi:hypothetical protein